jgi:hypothetical protein
VPASPTGNARERPATGKNPDDRHGVDGAIVSPVRMGPRNVLARSDIAYTIRAYGREVVIAMAVFGSELQHSSTGYSHRK